MHTLGTREMKNKTTAILLPIILLLVGWCVYPKSIPHPMNEKYVTAYYRGFGLPGAPSILGTLWDRVQISATDGGKWIFEYEHEGYNNFKGYYPNGNICEEGECFVEIMGFHDQPFPDQHKVRNSKCYLPDGTLGSEVKDGTGIQTYWTPKDVKTWELVLKDYVRQKLTMWYPNGQMLGTKDYSEGEVHGPFESYYQDGNIKTTGSYIRGKRNGTWKRFHENGLVESLEVYEDGKLVSEQKSP